MREPIDILNPLVAEMLKAMENVFREFGVDFFLVGAVARDIRLAVGDEFTASRTTNDVDIAILLTDEDHFNNLKNALIATKHFEECAGTDIRLIYKGGTEVDLLPFGEIENEEGEVRLNKHGLITMDMSGFKKVYPFVETINVADGLSINVCTIEGLILLKLIANYDNPSRTKDITDIEHFLEVYFDINCNEIFDGYFDAMELYDTEIQNYMQLVSARVIGRKMKIMLEQTSHTSEDIKTILANRPVATWQAMLDGLID